jgi:hypothetical protein
VTRQARLAPGAIVNQGDNVTINTVQNTVVTVEDRAQILAEVGAALRPVLARLVARVEQLERDNRALTDTLASIAAVMPARKHPLNAIGPAAPSDVGSDPSSVTRYACPPGDTPGEALSWGQPSLLEELRHAG